MSDETAKLYLLVLQATVELVYVYIGIYKQETWDSELANWLCYYYEILYVG